MRTWKQSGVTAEEKRVIEKEEELEITESEYEHDQDLKQGWGSIRHREDKRAIKGREGAQVRVHSGAVI